jgi:hypothetical protein
MTLHGRITIARLMAALAAGAILFAAADGAYAERKTGTNVPRANVTDRTQQPSPTTTPPPSKCKDPKGCAGGGKK